MTLTLARGTFGLRPAVERNREAAIVQPSRAALVAQLDRASDFESEGREFESLRARQHLDDVVWNVVGILLGIAFATLFTGDGIVVVDPARELRGELSRGSARRNGAW